MRIFAILCLVALVPSGCGDKNSGQPPSAGSGKPWHALKLEKLGLQVDIPARQVVRVMDLTVPGDPPSLSIPLVDCETEIAAVPDAPDAPEQSLEQAKKAIAADYADWHPAFTRLDQTRDGWVIEFGSDSKQGSQDHAMLHLEVRRTIGGKAYRCSLNTRDPAERACAAKVCASLRPL